MVGNWMTGSGHNMMVTRIRCLGPPVSCAMLKQVLRYLLSECKKKVLHASNWSSQCCPNSQCPTKIKLYSPTILTKPYFVRLCNNKNGLKVVTCFSVTWLACPPVSSCGTRLVALLWTAAGEPGNTSLQNDINRNSSPNNPHNYQKIIPSKHPQF